MRHEKTQSMQSTKDKSNNLCKKNQQPFSLFLGSIFTAFFFSLICFVSTSAAGEVWVANMKGANVEVIDTSSNKIIKTIATGAGAHNVTFSPDGKLAYIANLGTNSITIIDAATKEKLANVLTAVSYTHLTLPTILLV